MFTGKKSAPKKVKWAGTPIVHIIDANSPSVRRIDMKHTLNPMETTNESTLRVEMAERGLDPKKQDRYATLLHVFNDELRDELREQWGIELSGGNQELVEMINLARVLNRRAHLRLSIPAGSKMPTEMNATELAVELSKRNISTTNETLEAQISALEEAMLKETEGAVGGGYCFGQRFLSVEEFLELEEYADADLRDLIKARGIKAPRLRKQKQDLLVKIMEDDLQATIRDAFRAELDEEILRKNIPVHKRKLKKSVSTSYSRIANLPTRNIVFEAGAAAIGTDNKPFRVREWNQTEYTDNPTKRLKFDELASPKKVNDVNCQNTEELTDSEIGVDASRDDQEEESTETLFKALLEEGSWKAYYSNNTKNEGSRTSSRDGCCVS